jgi:hypothetical protein
MKDSLGSFQLQRGLIQLSLLSRLQRACRVLFQQLNRYHRTQRFQVQTCLQTCLKSCPKPLKRTMQSQR